MGLYKVIIPIDGLPYIQKISENNISPTATGYNISSASIDILEPNYDLSVALFCNWIDMRKHKPVYAEIYSDNEDERNDEYSGIDKITAERIVDTLSKREWHLWNHPPKN
jgi:hypothetical protein